MRFDISATNYSYTTLEKLTTYFKSGKSITENLSNNGKYPVFGGNGLRGYTDIYNFDGEYILIGRQGALCGNVKRYNGKFYATEHAIVVKALQDTNYLFYLLQYMNLGQYSGQSAQPGLAVNKVVKLLCLIPNLDEQKKVGELFTKIDARIQSQSKIIEEYESLINRIRKTIFSKLNCEWEKLNNLIEKGFISLYRGNIIPKHEKDNTHIYPVYSSSVQKDGLMGYSDNFMFDEELITWSIDGGGDIFYRHKHKFSVTNVCGIMKVDTHYYNYRFMSEILKDEHSRMVFDYQTKAHPSVINKLYSLPQISIEEQLRISKIFDCLYSKLEVEKELLKKLKEQKKYLLSNMFI